MLIYSLNQNQTSPPCLDASCAHETPLVGVARCFATDNRQSLEQSEEAIQLTTIQKQVSLDDHGVDQKDYMKRYLQFVNSQNLRYKSLLIDQSSSEQSATLRLADFKGFNMEMENK